MALFISFEGGEGSGKSTQAGRLHRALSETGVSTLLIHEPGTTRLGLHIRQLIKSRPWGEDIISPIAELFLFSASRAELVEKTLKPEMDRSQLVVIADRYVHSTVAYQGYGRGIRIELIDAINELACQDVMPDVSFLLDCDPADGLKRVESQAHLFDSVRAVRSDADGSRRFEEEPIDFHRRIRRGYLKLAKDKPEKWIVLDAMDDPDVIFEQIWNAVQGMEKLKTVPRQMSLLPPVMSASDDSLPEHTDMARLI